MYLYQRFGRTVFNNVIDDLGGQIDIQKTLTLDELHIYGSSRHGIHKPQKRVVRKTYILEEIDSEGEFDYGAAQDSTIAKVNYKFFSRRLTYKQYELANHLGNVLATIFDRKTPQVGADTVLYYDADVSTSGMYYAFGSTITDLSYTNDTMTYRYGFNGKEFDTEGMGGGGITYDYGFRIYNPALGKFLSRDPLFRAYPWYTPYQFAGNKPIRFIDLDGLEEYDPADDEYAGARLILTYYFDVKHSLYNLVLSPFRANVPFNGTVKVRAGYKVVNGRETFETEFKILPVESALEEIGNTALDALNVAGAGRVDPSDILFSKTPGTNSVRTAKEIYKTLHNSIGTVKNTKLNGKWEKQTRGTGKGMEYQSWISGKKYDKTTKQIEEYHYNDVYFDGYSNGILYDAKDNYRDFIDPKTGLFKKYYANSPKGGQHLIKEANDQIRAANGVKLQWIFSQEDSLKATYQLLKDGGVEVSKIDFKFVPKSK